MINGGFLGIFSIPITSFTNIFLIGLNIPKLEILHTILHAFHAYNKNL
jgi:hypothetical protein